MQNFENLGIFRVYPGTDYPDCWKPIANTVKTLANWECEHCGHVHAPELGRCLTVHYLNGNKADCRYENLVALCQACHLHIQAVYRPGQYRLTGEQYSWAVKRGLM
jgi:hypothetical protein